MPVLQCARTSSLGKNNAECRVSPLDRQDWPSRTTVRITPTKLVLSVLLLGAVSVGGAFLCSHAYEGDRAEPTGPDSNPSQGPSNIACLGHIEPKDGVALISARSLAGQPSIIDELKVREGDWVKTNQVLALLDSHDQLQAVVKDFEGRVAVAETRLALVQAGARNGDIAAQQAEVARLEAELATYKAEYERYNALYQKQAVTVSDYAKRALAVSDAEQMVRQAEARLTSMKEVRDVDLHLAEAEIRAATAGVARAKAELAASVVRAPFDGQVLKVHAHLGEEVGASGVLELAKTDQMYVVAEVYESDVGRVRKDQKATITGDALKKPLQGKVETIGNEIAKNDVANLDPVSLSDTRIIEVKIRLDDSGVASHLVHAKVNVVIQP
jgi:HlyD family secretion protein